MREFRRSGAANILGAVWCGLLLAALAPAAVTATAQEVRWEAYADGERLTTVDSAAATADAAARDALTSLHAEGHLGAVVDSAVVEAGAGVVYLSRGPVATVSSVDLRGISVVDVAVLSSGLETRAGRPFSAEALSGDITLILRALERAGRPMASAEVSRLQLNRDGVEIEIAVEEGEAHVLRGVELLPDGRTNTAFAARLAGLAPGEPLQRYDPGAVRRQLEASGLFASVGEPELTVDEEGLVVIRVPAEEAQPGAVDLVLGYLPPATAAQSGALVGSGSLVLRNLFGRGRRLSLELIRNPGLVSAIDVRVSDPFLFNLPLRMDARFSGYQQDSTFSRSVLGIEAGYRLGFGLEAIAVGSREYVEAGIAGTAVVDGRQLVPGASAWFGGVGARFARVDRPLNPRSGLLIETLLEQGVKRRTLPHESDEVVRVSQQRFRASGRVFIPTLTRQSAVVGADGAVLLGDVYDDSDLFRFGGATSLRGYDEEQFRGNVVGRALVEYRYLLDPTSFAFAFLDVGYVQRPETPGVPASERVLPGYGIGLQYRTPLGLATATYAVNPDDGPTRGRVHVGLSVGL